MALTELERIYDLKTKGVDKVLDDINSIADAFERSAKAKASLGSGNGIGIDNGQLATTNKLLNDLVSGQEDLLAALKNVNVEFSKSAGNAKSYSQAANAAADATDNMSATAKMLGINLTSASSGLLKVQSTLNRKSIEDYDAALLTLSEQFLVIQENLARTKIQFADLREEQANDAITSEEFEERQRALTAQLYQQGAALGETVQAMNLLNKTMNPAIPADYTLAVKQEAEANMLLAKSADEAKDAAIQLGAAKRQLAQEVKAGVLDETGESYDKRIATAQKGIDAREAELAKLEQQSAKRLQILEDARTKEQEMLDAANDKQAASIEAQNLKVAKLEIDYLNAQMEQEEKQEQLWQQQILKGEAWAASIEADAERVAAAMQKLRGNQELRGEAAANSIEADEVKARQKRFDARPENQAARKLRMQDERTQVELLKQQAIQASETASYYQKLNAELSILRINFRQLATAEEVYGEKGKAMQARAAAIHEELVGLDKGIGNSQRTLGDYARGLLNAGNLMQMFTRQLVRGVGSILIWQVLFEAITKVGEAIVEAIPGTDAYIKKQNELAEAAESTAKAIMDEVDAGQKYVEHIRDLLGTGDAAAQQKIDLQKAIGIINGQNYKAEVEQLDVVAAKRNRDIAVLQERAKALQDVASANIATKGNYDSYEALKTNNPDIPVGSFDDLQVKIAKLKADGYKSEDLYLKLEADIVTEQENIRIQQEKLRNENANDKVALESKTNAKIYEKNKELNQRLIQLSEDYRVMQEKGEAEHVDRIVSGIDRKYAALIAANQRAAVEYAKDISLYVPDKGDYAADGKTLTKEAISKEYQAIKGLEAFKKFGLTEQDYQVARQAQKADDVSEFRGKQIIAQTGYEAGQLTTNAGTSKSLSDFGQANYGKMVSALDAETQAKKAALKIQHDNQVKFIDDNYQDRVVWAQKQKELETSTTNALKVIDNDAYQKRLGYASEYFKRITETSDTNSRALIAQLDTATQLSINTIMRKNMSGSISDRKSDKRIDKATNQGIVADQSAIIKQLGGVDIPGLRETRDMAGAEVTAAEISGDAGKLAIARLNLANATEKLADAELKLQQAEGKRLEATKKLKPHDYTKDIMEGLISIGETLANSYMELLAKEDAYRAEMAQRSLAWNQKVQESEVQSNNEKLAEEKANFIASNELAKEKAQQDKKRAEQQLLINAAVAMSKAAATDFGEDGLGAAKFFIDSGIILAQLAIQESMIARAPAYAQGTSGHPGGWAWVGDGNENELIKFGNQLAISPNRPTLTNLPAGAEVTPFSKIANVPGNLGAGLSAPRFVSSSSGGGGNNDGMMEHVQTIYGMIGDMAKHVSNIKTYVTAKDINKGQKSYSTKVRAI